MSATTDAILKARIRTKLAYKIPPFIRSAKEWASAIDAAVDEVMDTIEKHKKEMNDE